MFTAVSAHVLLHAEWLLNIQYVYMSTHAYSHLHQCRFFRVNLQRCSLAAIYGARHSLLPPLFFFKSLPLPLSVHSLSIPSPIPRVFLPLILSSPLPLSTTFPLTACPHCLLLFSLVCDRREDLQILCFVYQMLIVVTTFHKTELCLTQSGRGCFIAVTICGHQRAINRRAYVAHLSLCSDADSSVRHRSRDERSSTDAGTANRQHRGQPQQTTGAPDRQTGHPQ